MKKIGTTKFKEQCLLLIEKLEAEGLIITKHGVPVAKMIPVGNESRGLIGSFKGKIKVKGKIDSTGS